MTDVIMTVFVIAVLYGWVVIENNQSIEPPHWNKAVELCKDNGGIQKVSVDLEDIQVKCLNGAKFDTTKSKVEGE